MKRFENKIVYVTGATGGIGREIVDLFAKEGATIALFDLDQALLSNKIDQCALDNVISRGYPADLTNVDQLEAAVKSAQDELGPADILINNAGGSRGRNFVGMDVETWRWNLDLNLTAAFAIARLLLPSMMERRQGAIVSVASINGIRALGDPAYSVAKAGLISLTQQWAMAYAKYGIRANAILPGTTVTAGWKKAGLDKEERLERLRHWYPGGELGTAVDMVSAIAFLASDEARFINGAALPVDGGVSISHPHLARDLTNSEQ